MKTVVVYDSVFGNTEKIARAIGAALGPGEDVPVIKVGDVSLAELAGVSLLIVGSPTRGFQPTPALTDFLKSIPPGNLKDVKAAAFDTRIPNETINSPILRALVRFGGYAADPIAKALGQKGATLVAPPEGFLVKDREGPLEDGEIERAAGWARRILAIVQPASK